MAAIGTIDVHWMGDIRVDDAGNTLLVDGNGAYLQRLVRRLLTTPRGLDQLGNPSIPPDYIFSTSFGAGLRRIINTPLVKEEIRRIVTQQILADPETNKDSPPDIQLDTTDLGYIRMWVIAYREPNVPVSFGLRVGGS